MIDFAKLPVAVLQGMYDAVYDTGTSVRPSTQDLGWRYTVRIGEWSLGPSYAREVDKLRIQHADGEAGDFDRADFDAYMGPHIAAYFEERF